MRDSNPTKFSIPKRHLVLYVINMRRRLIIHSLGKSLRKSTNVHIWNPPIESTHKFYWLLFPPEFFPTLSICSSTNNVCCFPTLLLSDSLPRVPVVCLGDDRAWSRWLWQPEETGSSSLDKCTVWLTFSRRNVCGEIRVKIRKPLLLL